MEQEINSSQPEQQTISKQERKEIKFQEKQVQRQSQQREQNMKKIKRISFYVAIVIVVIAAGGFWTYQQNQPGELDDFAICLADNGALFYGAFWCPHCQDQKEMFGRSERLLPYIECSTPDGQGQTSECSIADIKGYPTWEFADGTRESGVITLEGLAARTGCELPQ